MYLLLVEVDTFEVAGLRFGSVEMVREAIERILGDRGCAPGADDFNKLMWSMCSNLDAEWRWCHQKGGVEITVRRYA